MAVLLRKSMSEVFIGTSGWSYAHWNGVLYPEDCPPAERLALYQSEFATVELNSSHYNWPPRSYFASWKKRLRADFRMAIKAPGALTHQQRLCSPETWLHRIASDLEVLSDTCGPLLVQVPPTLPIDLPRLHYFLEQLPDQIKVAMEFRHSSWHCESVFETLEKHQVAYCVMSGAGLPCILRATTNFVYARLHGPDPNAMYAGSYSDEDLRWWAERIREWKHQEQDVYLYFNNDGEGNAVRNARRLLSLFEEP